MTRLLIIFSPLGVMGLQADYITFKIEEDLDQSYKKASKTSIIKSRRL